MIEGKMHIGGNWVDAKSGKIRSIINPFNRKVIARVAEGDREDAREAIRAARTAFDDGEWPKTAAVERGEMIYMLGLLVEKKHEELAHLECIDTGKTFEESRWDIAEVARTFKYFGGLADKNAGEIIDSPLPHSSSMVLREPIGVCGQITPWNYPLLQASWKMAPALAAGCTVVMKPSEITPLSLVRMTELATNVGIPKGVINLVLGPGETVGAELAESLDVDHISFTGGIFAGRKIIRAASRNVKKIALELGGKNPHIIFVDADLETALDYLLNGVFFHAGQVCSAGARVLIESPIHDELVEALKTKMEKIVLGNGLDKKTQMGPLISEERREKVEEYIRIGLKEGAKLVTGGERPKDPELQKGFFLEPTLFTGCTNDMRIVREEIFGPVVSVEKFDSEAEAVEMANDTIFGLTAGFWTRDPDRIHRVSRSLRFGTVWVNDFNTYFSEAPWGGYKQSGLGRELGRTGIEEFTEVKHVFQNHAPAPFNWFGT